VSDKIAKTIFVPIKELFRLLDRKRSNPALEKAQIASFKARLANLAIDTASLPAYKPIKQPQFLLLKLLPPCEG
jgi:hypothetical protein